MKSALDVHRELLAAGVPHEMVRLPSPVPSADDLPRALDVPRSRCVVVRCYRIVRRDALSELVAVLVRAGDTPDAASLLTALDAVTVRPASAGEINAGTDYAADLVSPLCLPEPVRLLADAALAGRHAADGAVYTATGESGVALGIQLRDLLVACDASVTTLTAQRLSYVDRVGWDRARDRDERPTSTAGPGPRRSG